MNFLSNFDKIKIILFKSDILFSIYIVLIVEFNEFIAIFIIIIVS
jgi:hypothetical protein